MVVLSRKGGVAQRSRKTSYGPLDETKKKIGKFAHTMCFALLRDPSDFLQRKQRSRALRPLHLHL